MDHADVAAELTRLKKLLDDARTDFENFLKESKVAEGAGWDGPADQARMVTLQTHMEARRRLFEMRLTDWQQARDEEARARSAEARTAHEAEMTRLAKNAEDERTRAEEVKARQERAAERAEQRHKDEMAELQRQSTAHQREANKIQSRVFWLSAAIIFSTIAIGILQVWATLKTK